MNAVRFRFIGDLDGARFTEFAEHRARRLDIELRVVDSGSEFATFDVGGPPDLVDMFEMACSLGPLTCIVRDVERRVIGNAAFTAGDSSGDDNGERGQLGAGRAFERDRAFDIGGRGG